MLFIFTFKFKIKKNLRKKLKKREKIPVTQLSMLGALIWRPIWCLLFELSIILTLTFRMSLSMCQIFSRRFVVYEMFKFTLEENWEILKTFFRSKGSSTETKKIAFKIRKKKEPSRQFVDSFVKRVRETGSFTRSSSWVGRKYRCGGRMCQ